MAAEQRKPLSFAAALRLKPGERQNDQDSDKEEPNESLPISTPSGYLDIQQSGYPDIQTDSQISKLDIQKSSNPDLDSQISKLDIQQSSYLDIQKSKYSDITNTEIKPKGAVAAAEKHLPSRTNTKAIFGRIPVELEDSFHKITTLMRIDKKVALTEAIQMWISKHQDIQQSGYLDIQQSAIINKESLVVRNYLLGIYSKLSGRPITEKEEEAFMEVAHYSPLDIELGILLSRERADNQQQKINGFRYCHVSIKQTAQSPMADFEKKERLDDLKFKYKVS
jgi:hypothetical protein